MTQNNPQNGNMWFKLFALMIVGGVAKELFGPPPAPRVTYNQTTPAKDES